VYWGRRFQTGEVIEQDGSNLLSPLANTAPITIGLRRYIYDFLSFDTFTLGFESGESTTKLPLETYDGSTTNSVIKDVPTIFDAKANINSDQSIAGEISCNTLSTTGDASVGGSLIIDNANVLGTKQDEININFRFDLTFN